MEPEKITCERCESEVEETFDVGGEQWCADCRDSDAEQCADCGAWFAGLDRENADEEPVCEDCGENYFCCYRCGCTCHNDDAYGVDGDVWCAHCCENHTFRCIHCEEVFSDTASSVSTSDGELCSSCYDDSYFTCDRCCEVRHNDNYVGNNCCVDCTSHAILDYSDRSANRLGPFGPGPTRYGVELEVGVTSGDDSEKAEEVLNRIGTDFAVCKHDSSITCDSRLSGGFEIVTAPSDVATHRERWAMAFTTRIPGLRSWDTTSCGMHVHVSRAGLSRLTIGKINVFLNDPRNGAFVTAIAGRSPNDYCGREPKRIGSAHHPGYRYEALNLTNRNTIEFRIFRGTLKVQSILKNIEFCAALINWARQAGTTCMGSHKAFLAHVAKTPKVWPNLAAWLREHDYIAKPRTRPGVQPEPCSAEL